MKAASVPFVRRQRDAVALGGQQATRLQQLRVASERLIHEQHLQSAGDGSTPTRNSRELAPVAACSSQTSRTVEAVVASRQVTGSEESKASRLRKTIRDARGGIQTERSERPRTTTEQHSHTMSSRPVTHAAHVQTQGIRQAVAAVRRRVPTSSRKLTRDELEWIEKQLQFTQRAGLLERECRTWWQSFYSSAGTSSDCGDEAWATPLSIQRQIDAGDQRRFSDTQDLQNQLNALRAQADNVMHMVHAMRDGTEFIHDLHEAMGAFESALSTFRVTQRERFDTYVTEEKLLDRDLAEFLVKTETWEQHESDTKQKIKTARDKRHKDDVRYKEVERNSESDQSNQSHEVSPESATDSTMNELDLVKQVRVLNARILESGGSKGSWDDRDHALFASILLKLGLTDEVLMRNQFSFEPSNQETVLEYETLVARFLRKCFKVIVTRSENAIRNHFEWYLGHLQLVLEKKEAIQQWKQRKESERQQRIKQGLYHSEESETPTGLEAGMSTQDVSGDERDKRRTLLESKEREERARKLDEWRELKEKRAKELQEQEEEKRVQLDAQEAKRRQKLLEKKQQVLVYKLQREQEASATKRRNNAVEAPSPSSPALNQELIMRSRKAIELAKAKRAQLQAIEERRQQQSTLPEQPKSVVHLKSSSAASPTDSEQSPSTREATLLKPTKAHEARQLSKIELKRREKQRTKQGAHEAYFPGASVVSDVKIKSFGHTAIAPRAVPTWRRNI